MVRARILKRGESRYLELPKELCSADELELFALRDGYYLLSIPLGGKAEPQKKGIRLAPEEIAVLQKLLRIRFEKRVPPYVSKALNEQEQKVLAALEKKGFVNVFKGRKYQDGVYNIRDDVYPLIRPSGAGNTPDKTQSTQSAPAGQYGMLRDRGFMVLGNKNEAREFSERANQEIKNGSLKGVKGFDGKFYVVTEGYLTKASEIILKKLDRDMNLETLAKETKLEMDGCTAVLRLLAESGDIIEKKKGMFAAV
ncbi:MAG: hypothetical protein ABII71_03340 [Candidatus Micrarchaeota archaeon]